MLVKRSARNQVSIPKAVLERAGLGEEDLYFDVQYEKGRIVLIPIQVEEKVPKEDLERFEAETLKQKAGDKVYGSVEEVLKGLHQRHRRSR